MESIGGAFAQKMKDVMSLKRVVPTICADTGAESSVVVAPASLGGAKRRRRTRLEAGTSVSSEAPLVKAEPEGDERAPAKKVSRIACKPPVIAMKREALGRKSEDKNVF